MARPKPDDELTTAELQALLRERRQTAAQQRLARLRAEGRLVEAPGAPTPDPAEWAAIVEQTTAAYGREAALRRRLDQALFLVELLALIGLGLVAAQLWQTDRALNADLDAIRLTQVAQIGALQAQTQKTATAAAQAPVVATPSVPSPVATVQFGRYEDWLAVVATPSVPSPVATVAAATPLPPTAAPVATQGRVVSAVNAPAVLPGGHEPPAPGAEPQPGEAGIISPAALATLQAYQPPPTPSSGMELALRIRIPAIGVDHPVVQGDSWEQLKTGVGQFIGSANPGQVGNVVLSAHNDIYGETFRYLDQLSPGDEVILSTASRDYTYVVDEVRIVLPTDVWVMGVTARPQVTLISCFPYRINTHRVVVFGRLMEPTS